MVVVSVAVQDAPAFIVAPAGVQLTGAPRFVVPFLNCTVPVGPWLELLCDVTTAVTLIEVAEFAVPATTMAVVAGVIVTLNVLLGAPLV